MTIELLLTEEGVVRKIERSKKLFYVYTIFGGTMGPIYVGKGSGKRVLRHVEQARRFLSIYPDLPYEEWVCSGQVLRMGKVQRLAAHLSYAPLRFRIDLFTNVESKAFDKEIELISKYGRCVYGRGTLSNLTPGGAGGGCRGRAFSTQRRKRISEALAGRPLSDAHKQALRTALTGRALPDEVRRKMSKARMGQAPTVVSSIRVNGVAYPSITSAARKLGINYQTLRSRLTAQAPGYSYISSKVKPA